MAPTFKQDMPPPGGYQGITWERIPARKIISGFGLLTGVTAVTTVSLYIYYLGLKRVRRHELEVNDAKLAIEPLLLAERDREYLKQLRRNRDEETKLMKDVPGWKTGTYYGEPIYKTLKKDEWVDPFIEEYYAHSHPRDQKRRQLLSLHH